MIRVIQFDQSLLSLQKFHNWHNLSPTENEKPVGGVEETYLQKNIYPPNINYKRKLHIYLILKTN